MGREIDRTRFRVFCETAAWAKWFLGFMSCCLVFLIGVCLYAATLIVRDPAAGAPEKAGLTGLMVLLAAGLGALAWPGSPSLFGVRRTKLELDGEGLSIWRTCLDSAQDPARIPLADIVGLDAEVFRWTTVTIVFWSPLNRRRRGFRPPNLTWCTSFVSRAVKNATPHPGQELLTYRFYPDVFTNRREFLSALKESARVPTSLEYDRLLTDRRRRV